MNELKTEIRSIIQYYYQIEKDPSRLWEIVCDILDIEYDDENIGEIFDEEFYNKSDVLNKKKKKKIE